MAFRVYHLLNYPNDEDSNLLDMARDRSVCRCGYFGEACFFHLQGSPRKVSRVEEVDVKECKGGGQVRRGETVGL